MEAEERLRVLDKDICDEEDVTIAQDVASEDQQKERGDSCCGTRERKLVCVDETGKLPLLCFKNPDIERMLRYLCNSVSKVFSSSVVVSNTFAIGERGIFFLQNDKDK